MTQSRPRKQRLQAPPHPGTAVGEALLLRRITVLEAAELLRVSRPALSNVINGNTDLTALMARRLEKVFGLDLDDLMAMQAAVNLAKARALSDEEEAKI